MTKEQKKYNQAVNLCLDCGEINNNCKCKEETLKLNVFNFYKKIIKNSTFMKLDILRLDLNKFANSIHLEISFKNNTTIQINRFSLSVLKNAYSIDIKEIEYINFDKYFKNNSKKDLIKKIIKYGKMENNNE